MTTTDTQFQAEPAVYNETGALLVFFKENTYFKKRNQCSPSTTQLLTIKPYFQNMRIN